MRCRASRCGALRRDVLLPLYFRVLGFGPIAIALATTPIAASFLVVSPLAGRAMGRLEAMVLAVTGYLVGCAGALAMALGAVTEDYAWVLPGLVMFACGLALAQAPVTAVAISDVPAHRLGVASSLPNISRYAGGALGTAVLGVVMHASIPEGAERSMERAVPAVRDDIVTGFRLSLLVGMVFLVAAAAVATRIPRLRLSTSRIKGDS